MILKNLIIEKFGYTIDEVNDSRCFGIKGLLNGKYICGAIRTSTEISTNGTRTFYIINTTYENGEEIKTKEYLGYIHLDHHQNAGIYIGTESHRYYRGKLTKPFLDVDGDYNYNYDYITRKCRDILYEYLSKQLKIQVYRREMSELPVVDKPIVNPAKVQRDKIREMSSVKAAIIGLEADLKHTKIWNRQKRHNLKISISNRKKVLKRMQNDMDQFIETTNSLNEVHSQINNIIDEHTSVQSELF